MNISSVGYRICSSIQNQNTSVPNFKATLVGTITKSVGETPKDMLLAPVNNALMRCGAITADDRLVASTGNELFVWLNDSFKPLLDEASSFLNGCYNKKSGITFRVVDGMHDAVKKHLAELASKNQ